MPFTFSHPAIILPLTKYSGRYLSLTGLIMGSIAPDFEYFFRMRIQSNFSHTVGGLFYFDLPVGLLLSIVFHNLIRDALYENLPTTLKNRLRVFKTFKWNEYFRGHYFVVIVSILIGASSHLFWDSFTHIHGYFVDRLSTLQGSVNFMGHDIGVYKLLQHLSTLIGGLVIAFVFSRLPTDNMTGQKISVKYWLIVSTITVAIVGLRLAFGVEKNFFGQLIGTGITALLIALTFAPTLTKLKI
ncbi:MAG: DUF4184 family protein [Cytophagales bacterium]|jgi:hypothetical protein|nr:DUF4184 family protein [Cytophagales bacterium]